MGEQRRGADGRRLFDAEFKRQQASRIARGDATVAEVARKWPASWMPVLR
jgi:transposase-like protein